MTMRLIGLSRDALGIGLAVAMLAGCGGVQQAGTTGAMAQGTVATTPGRAQKASGSYGDLLYLRSDSTRSDLAVLTFPGGKLVGSISGIGKVLNLCSDTSGNVWAVTENYPGDFLYEFAHGGTSPIVKLTGSTISWDCSVDPTTGNLAVVTYDIQNNSYIYIWKPYSGRYSGSPTILPTIFNAWAVTYDGSGNLFVAGGIVISSSVNFVLAELPYGKSEFKQLAVDRPAVWPSGLRWDGKYLALYTGGPSMRGRIYRLRVSGSKAITVKTLHFAHMMKRPPNMWIFGNTIISDAGRKGSFDLTFWHYPSGQPYETLPYYYGPSTVSVAPSGSHIRQ